MLSLPPSVACNQGMLTALLPRISNSPFGSSALALSISSINTTLPCSGCQPGPESPDSLIDIGFADKLQQQMDNLRPTTAAPAK